MSSIIYIVDGNNLAHGAYDVPGARNPSTETEQRMVDELADWVERASPQRVQVELCLDRAHAGLVQPSGVRLVVASFPADADELIGDRVAFHRFQGKLCTVVTDDEELSRTARGLGARALRVRQFVRDYHQGRPRFADPPARLPTRRAPSHDTQARWEAAHERKPAAREGLIGGLVQPAGRASPLPKERRLMGTAGLDER